MNRERKKFVIGMKILFIQRYAIMNFRLVYIELSPQIDQLVHYLSFFYF